MTKTLGKNNNMKFGIVSFLVIICILFGWTVGQTEINDGLIAHWNFDENVIDVTGNGHDGTIYGLPKYENSVSCKGIQFSHSNYVIVEKDIKLDCPEYTLAVVFQIDKFKEPEWEIIVSRMKTAEEGTWSDAWDLCVNANDRRIYWWYYDREHSWDRNCISKTTIEAGIPYCVTVRVKNGIGELIVDNVVENIFTVGNIWADGDLPICIGCNDYNSIVPGQYSNALVDELRIYNRAITDNENTEIYNLAGPCTNRGTSEIPFSCLESSLKILPQTINLKSHGKTISAHIDFENKELIKNVDIDTIFFEEILSPLDIKRGKKKIHLKFDRQEIIGILERAIEDLPTKIESTLTGNFNVEIELTITGSFNDGTCFFGSDTVKIVH